MPRRARDCFCGANVRCHCGLRERLQTPGEKRGKRLAAADPLPPLVEALRRWAASDGVRAALLRLDRVPRRAGFAALPIDTLIMEARHDQAAFLLSRLGRVADGKAKTGDPKIDVPAAAFFERLCTDAPTARVMGTRDALVRDADARSRRNGGPVDPDLPANAKRGGDLAWLCDIDGHWCGGYCVRPPTRLVAWFDADALPPLRVPASAWGAVPPPVRSGTDQDDDDGGWWGSNGAPTPPGAADDDGTGCNSTRTADGTETAAASAL